jgi:hypothetical protein
MMVSRGSGGGGAGMWRVWCHAMGLGEGPDVARAAAAGRQELGSSGNGWAARACSATQDRGDGDADMWA